jgi:hypothetical protein
MAIMMHAVEGNNGGRLTLEVGAGSTGADLTLQPASGDAVTVFVGSEPLLTLAGKCAAIALGVNDGPQEINLYAGPIGYGIDPDGAITLDPDHGEVTVTLRACSGRFAAPGTPWLGEPAKVSLDVGDIANLGQIAAAAAHDL